MKKNTEKFSFFVPAIVKSGEKGQLTIEGICSSISKDSDEEELDPTGFDYRPLLESGWFNYNHQGGKDPSAILGRPTEAKVVNNGKDFYVKGFLYKGLKASQDIYNLAQVLAEEDPSGRTLGFSIEGTATKRNAINPKKIERAQITGIAITASPKNPNTFLSIVKGQYSDQLMTDEGISDNMIVKARNYHQLLKNVIARRTGRTPDEVTEEEIANAGRETHDEVQKSDLVDFNKSTECPKCHSNTLVNSECTSCNYLEKKSEKAMSAGSTTGTQTTGTLSNGAALKKEDIDGIHSTVSKSEVYNTIFSRYTQDIQKSKEIYSYILNVSNKLNDNMENKISKSTLDKALELLDQTMVIEKSKKDEVEETTTTTTEKVEKSKKNRPNIEGDYNCDEMSSQDHQDAAEFHENESDKDGIDEKEETKHMKLAKTHKKLAKEKKEKESEKIEKSETTTTTTVEEKVEKSETKEERESKMTELAKSLLKAKKTKGEAIDDMVIKGGYGIEESRVTVEKVIREFESEREGGSISQVSIDKVEKSITQVGESIRKVSTDLNEKIEKSLNDLSTSLETQISERFEKSFGGVDELIKGLGDQISDKFKYVGQILKSQTEQSVELLGQNKTLTEQNDLLRKSFDALEQRLETVEQTPLEKKSLTTRKAIERFEKSKETTDEPGVTVFDIADKIQKGNLSKAMFDIWGTTRSQALPQGNKILNDAIMDLESTGTMQSAVLPILQQHKIKVIVGEKN